MWPAYLHAGVCIPLPLLQQLLFTLASWGSINDPLFALGTTQKALLWHGLVRDGDIITPHSRDL